MDISAVLSNSWDKVIETTSNLELPIIIAICIIAVVIVCTLYKAISILTTGKVDKPQQQAGKVTANVEKTTEEAYSWKERLKAGLDKTRTSLSGGLSELFSGQAKLDEDLLEEVHEKLYRADLGVDTATSLVDHLRKDLGNQKTDAVSWNDAKASLKQKISSMLNEVNHPTKSPSQGPLVILVVGVNGVGKTTSIGKLASHFLSQDKSVLLCAADTYRAAAIDQLLAWGNRVGCDVIKHAPGSDPASVAYDAVKSAKSRNTDVLLIDTAGRLHNKAELMDELSKIRRVISKDLPEAPHETWIVLDATTGQNAFQQLSAFGAATPLTGMVVTKLDGTAKGGVIIGASNKFKVPVRFIGVGEKAKDLQKFNSDEFVEMIL